MKAGIVADNYKVPLFEKEISAAGFTFAKVPFTEGSTLFQVEYVQAQFEQVKALCIKLNTMAVKKQAGNN